MGAKYYVAVRPLINEYHTVHKEGCPFLPDDEKRIYLGEFSSGMDAVEEGQQHFNKSKRCIFCSKEHKISNELPSLSRRINKAALADKLQIPISNHQTLFCCLN
jgi:hypothetical protein